MVIPNLIAVSFAILVEEEKRNAKCISLSLNKYKGDSQISYIN